MGNKYAASAGTKLFYGNTGAEATTRLGNIKGYDSLPSAEVAEIDITRVDQEDGNAIDWWRQFAPDRITAGDLGVTIGLDKDLVETLYGLLRAERSWKILFSDGSKLTFEGFLKNIEPGVETDGEITFGLTMKPSGKVTFTKAGGSP